MENPADAAPPLVPAPRHLRRRRLHGEIPDALLVPGAKPFPLVAAPAVTIADAQVDSRTKLPAAVLAKRKRAVALIILLVVSLSIPALLLALVLAG